MHTFKAFVTTAIALGMATFILTMPGKASEVDFSNPAFAPVGSSTSIPIGAAEFCKANRDECRPNQQPVAAAVLTEALWANLVGINNAVNTAVAPMTDEDYYSVSEYWAYPTAGYGDCEDYALAKRRDLVASGWNPSTLMIAVARQSDGSGHAVLMVRTDRGDLVLDNQDGRVLLWNETPYQYLKRQSQTDAGKWVDLLDKRMTFVASN